MSGARPATHAGSWYDDDSKTLDELLSDWLGEVDSTPCQEDKDFAPPVPNLKAIISPHAGYAYSGAAAAWAYACIEPFAYKRVFILGPSHHVYLNGCALSQRSSYKTPLGNLPLDLDTIARLRATRQFEDMSPSADDDEHSIEMQLPYIAKVFQGHAVNIVPIMVGSISTSKESAFGKLLAPYLADEDTLFVISSDFCHWGTRFGYTYYVPKEDSSAPVQLAKTNSAHADFPIHKSIELIDREGMRHVELTKDSGKSAQDAHRDFASYLTRTKNTICGRHPIGVLLATIASLQDSKTAGFAQDDVRLKFVRYERSSLVKKLSDSSVSYASAYFTASTQTV
ncbi:uncharacterized protein L969DRAFT_93432 [Mixia osmundae IAM 14324]|uniref:AmmeMemoRadiSam system protein B n=1 Tax=Mixia osmundae (strain CBS 9802 / IAM 14324 / JCM 22182 / KY 12970) TaxID=764103 RepID=G7DSA1_MIXOS|nr:uncharacterized protein L969DRAFT_93432 [Mixia osmundae IAM 14324]KEI40913.1 hypothetical protein L969DRAFT_93432 [Mixia osmundae IAM 14324]GAA93461.1 hypothetical protein E5Q_00102 [Mixia osmundae IAM 14324]